MFCAKGFSFCVIYILNNFISKTEGKFPIHGLVVHVFTPFDELGAINYDIIPTYVNFLADQDADGILIGGITGEGPAQSIEERRDVMLAFTKAARVRNLAVIVNVGVSNVPAIFELIWSSFFWHLTIHTSSTARYGEQFEVDALLLLPETLFVSIDLSYLVVCLKSVSDAAPSLPVLYYHYPEFTDVYVDIRELYNIATTTIPNFKGVKTDIKSAGDLVDLMAPGQIIYVDNDEIAPIVSLSLDSAIPTYSNLFPKLAKTILNAKLSGDQTTAEVLQKQYLLLVHAVTDVAEYVPGAKVAMEMVTGFNVGQIREPKTKVSLQQKQKIAQNLRSLGINLAVNY